MPASYDAVAADERRVRDLAWWNVGVLSACTATSMTAASMVILVAALVGQSLAPDPMLATLPIMLQWVGLLATSMPASLLMRRVGRRIGFTVGAAIGCVAGLTSMTGILAGDFTLFCLGGLLFGSSMSFAHFYRFAAADTATPDIRPRAISLVMAGGVVAAIIAPELAKATREAFAPILFAGTYAAIAAVKAIILVIVQFVRIPRLTVQEQSDQGRPLKQIMRQPGYIIAVGSAAIGYALMSLVMTATPLAMEAHSLDFVQTAFVIQWHALAMFAPSFVTGHLIKRFGVGRIIFAGVLLNAVALGINLAGTSIAHFWLALFALGLGWNFMFVGGTTLSTSTYTPAERNKAQAMNDVIVFSMVAVASLSSGLLQATVGWTMVNAAMILPTAVAFALVIWHFSRQPSMSNQTT